MVTAIEPIVQAVGGTWIAHGSGSADRLVVDKKGRIRPTERAKIHSPESMADEKGRRGLLLWPVEPSHMATLPYSLHQTAIFKKRLGDISNYFALSGLNPYHSSTQGVALGWNISSRWGYTNRECTLRIFPWGDKFLDGLLGNDILGFHLQYHGNNFFPSLKAHKPPGT